jgi:predicted short-subunit dehydrogenase-like oxidoreductase (DUF2520 family)
MKLVLIAAGNVATHLGKALKDAGHNILQVYSRSEPSAKQLAKKLRSDFTSKPSEINPKADIYLIAVSDNSIKDVVHTLANNNLESSKRKPIFIHTSGSIPINVFKKKFSHYGVVYPPYPFTKAKSASLKNIAITVEASDVETLKKLKRLCSSVAKDVVELNSEQRKTLHLAAVFANNFTNHFLVLAERILNKKNMSLDILRPLILESARRIQDSPPEMMQTGPARRGDTATLEEHLLLLKDNPRLQQLYRLISESIEETSGPRL